MRVLLLSFLTACQSPDVNRVVDASLGLDAELADVQGLTPWPAADYVWGSPERGCEEHLEVELDGARYAYGARLWDEAGRTVLEVWDEDLDGASDRWLRRRWSDRLEIEVADTRSERTSVYTYDYDANGQLTYAALDQGPTGRPNAEWYQEWDGDKLIWRGFDYPVGGDLEEERFQSWTGDEVYIAYHNHLWPSDNYTERRALDTDGRWTEGALDAGANGEIDWEIRWEWGDDDEPLSEVWSSSWEAVTVERVWSWGPNGLEARESRTLRADIVVRKEGEERRYDQHGRVIERAIFDTDPSVHDHRLISRWHCAVDPS